MPSFGVLNREADWRSTGARHFDLRRLPLESRLAEPALAARVDENIAAAEVELTSDDLREIDQALPQAQGARYSEANEKMIDR